MNLSENLFFGKISAGVTHDINNLLSIINENNGIISDYCSLPAGSMSLDEKSINRYCQNISLHTQKAAELVRHFNHFSHSMERSNNHTSLLNILKTFTILNQRLSRLNHLKFAPLPDNEDMPMRNPVFNFHHILYICLEHFIHNKKTDGTLTFKCQKENGNMRLTFMANFPKEDSNAPELLSQANSMLKPLNGQLDFFSDSNTQSQKFIFTLPLEF